MNAFRTLLQFGFSDFDDFLSERCAYSYLSVFIDRLSEFFRDILLRSNWIVKMELEVKVKVKLPRGGQVLHW